MAEWVEIIQLEGAAGEELAHRFPKDGNASIKWGAQLIVQETQMAVFFREGRALDTFGPGRHTLTTGNLPIVSGLLDKVTGSKPFFPAAVFFVNMNPNRIKWGTPGQIWVETADFGRIPMSTFGNYEVAIKDPGLFLMNIVKMAPVFTVEQLKDFYRQDVEEQSTDIVADMVPILGFFKVNSKTKKIGSMAKFRMRKAFERYGVELRRFAFSRFSTDKGIEEKMAQGIAAGVGTQEELQRTRGVIDVYAQKGYVDGFKEMAKNPGSAGGAMGMGAGLGMGLMMPGMVAQQAGMTPPGQQAPQQQAAQAPATVPCPACQAPNPPGAKFCQGCGGKLGSIKCPKCGADAPASAKFCQGCGSSMVAPKCPKCGTELQVGAKFCMSCGEKME